MHMTSRSSAFILLMAIGVMVSTAAPAAPVSTRALASNADAAPIPIGKRWYRDFDDDDYDDPPEYYLPPPPPVRIYPPALVYDPPVYGWLAPPRPSNCGKYRYWNGEYCADARYEPPYTGPRW